MVLLGIGMGLVFVPLTTASLAGVAPADSGAASSMVNVMQQVGGSLGLAVLVAVFGTASQNAHQHPVPGLTAAAQGQHVLAHGMATAFGVAAIFNVASLLVILALHPDQEARAAARRSSARMSRSPRPRPAGPKRRRVLVRRA